MQMIDPIAAISSASATMLAWGFFALASRRRHKPGRR
jgi:hypothetical protein